MAYLGNCQYCRGQILSGQWHPECRIAHLENILYELRMLVSVKRDADLETLFDRLIEITIILNQENWPSKAEFDKESQTHLEQAAAKQQYEAALAVALRTFVKDWKTEHPESSFLPHIELPHQIIAESTDLTSSQG